jgi:hypothetical protein
MGEEEDQSGRGRKAAGLAQKKSRKPRAHGPGHILLILDFLSTGELLHLLFSFSIIIIICYCHSFLMLFPFPPHQPYSNPQLQSCPYPKYPWITANPLLSDFVKNPPTMAPTPKNIAAAGRLIHLAVLLFGLSRCDAIQTSQHQSRVNIRQDRGWYFRIFQKLTQHDLSSRLERGKNDWHKNAQRFLSTFVCAGGVMTYKVGLYYARGNCQTNCLNGN